MAAGNIERFNLQVLRAIAFLYNSHPALVAVDHATISGSQEHDDGSLTVEIEDGSEHGTIIWQYRNGIVVGDLQESNPLEGNRKAAITEAQLSATAYRLLQSTDPNVGGVLGEAAVAGVSGPQASVIAKRVVDRLLGV